MRVFTLFCLLWVTLHATANEVVSIGKNISIHSTIIGEDRPISVFIPKGTKEGEKLFVIYLLDSQHHFHTVTGVVQSLVDYEQIPKTMVVGVHTTNRPRDYLPAVEGEPQTDFQRFKISKWPEAGQVDFLSFLNDELFPYIANNYPTYPHRTLIGHSNAGTLALSALFERPELFNQYLVISANGWWSREQMAMKVQELAAQKSSKAKMYITVAGEGGRFYSGTMDLLSNLESHQPESVSWTYKQYPNHTHMSGILPAVTDGIGYLFDDFTLTIPTSMAKYADVELLNSYYRDLSANSGVSLPVPVDSFVELAEQQKKAGRFNAAIVTLTQFVAAYPDYSYAHMRLAQGYEDMKDYQKSYASYAQALTLAKQQNREANIIDALQDMVNRVKQSL